ncbi:hypothetical protein GCM10011445_01540 [Pseudocitrobacter faecalis]|nr:hypothetical protein GCM10011445_01540 [Pseudocitrobacter faecalis]
MLLESKIYSEREYTAGETMGSVNVYTTDALRRNVWFIRHILRVTRRWNIDAAAQAG